MKTSILLTLLSFFACIILYSQGEHPELTAGKQKINPEPTYKDNGPVLYEQLSQPSLEAGVYSQMFLDYPTFTCQAADDFFVPEGAPWEIESLYFSGSFSEDPPGGPVEFVNVYFYEDAGNSPGVEIEAFYETIAVSTPEGNLDVSLPDPVILPQGHYWLSIQPVMTYSISGGWFWNRQLKPTIDEEFHWQNPGGGFDLEGTEFWQPTSVIPWPGSNEDHNLGFGIYGQGGGFPSIITHLSDYDAYSGQNIRIYGAGFGQFADGSDVTINGVQYTDEITYWSENEIFFNMPDFEDLPSVLLSVVTEYTLISNPVEIFIYEPTKVIFLNLKENEILSGDSKYISVAAEIDQRLINLAMFQYQLEGTTGWINFGVDTDGTAPHYSTYYPIGTGDGWGKRWDFSSLEDDQAVGIRATMVTIFGKQLIGEISVFIDRTPLAPVFIPEGSKLEGSMAGVYDSLIFNIDVKDENTESIEFNWQPIFTPFPGWWVVERDLDLINQMDVVFLDDKGDTVSHMACGPSAMASCLKWIARQYSDSEIGEMTVDSLAQQIARDAGTDSSGTSLANLEQAVESLVNSDSGIIDDFEIETTYNQSGDGGSNGPYHNVSNDIATGLRDSSDVVMLIYQKTLNGDTLGHYVTASSFHTSIHHEWHGTDDVAIQTSYVDFMDPATGQRTDKQIGWSSNPPTIEDYNLHPDSSSGTAWVHSVTTIKPVNGKLNRNTFIASLPVNGAGIYNFKLACTDLAMGNNMIGIFGVNSLGDKAMNSYIRCVNGQYEIVPYFSADRDTSITEYPVNFTDLSLHPDSVNWWHWEFGDAANGSSNDQNPSYAYSETGIFDVSLVVGDGNSFDTIIRPGFINIIDAVEQNVSKTAGWSGLSSFVDPANTNIQQIFSDAWDDLIILQNFDGVIWPSENINTLVDWDSQSGYKIKFSENVNINFKGFTEADPTVGLSAGWNILPIISQCNVSTQEIEDQLGVALTVVKEIAGDQVWWPEFGISTLGQLVPGTAYMLLLSDEESITFPACLKSDTENTIKPILTETPWGKVMNSPNSHLVCILVEALSTLNRGDVIGAFDDKGNCLGYSEISIPGDNISLVVFGDDPSDVSNNTLVEGQNMILKAFIKNRKEIVKLVPEYDYSMPDAGMFKTDGLSVIKKLNFSSPVSINDGKRSIHIFPNPTAGIVTIEGLISETEVEVYSSYGKLVFISVIMDEELINLSTLPEGIYLVKLIDAEGTHFEKLVLK